MDDKVPPNSDEESKRDRAMDDVASNPDNHCEMITDIARDWLIKQVSAGSWVVAGQVYRAVLDRNSNLVPHDKRVMGPVMKRMEKEKLIRAAGLSTRNRSHKGLAMEWQRTDYMARSVSVRPFFSPPRIFRKTRTQSQ